MLHIPTTTLWNKLVFSCHRSVVSFKPHQKTVPKAPRKCGLSDLFLGFGQKSVAFFKIKTCQIENKNTIIFSLNKGYWTSFQGLNHNKLLFENGKNIGNYRMRQFFEMGWKFHHGPVIEKWAANCCNFWRSYELLSSPKNKRKYSPHIKCTHT